MKSQLICRSLITQKALCEKLFNHLIQYKKAKEALRDSLDELAKLPPEDVDAALFDKARLQRIVCLQSLWKVTA